VPEEPQTGGSHVKVPIPSPYPFIITAGVCFLADVLLAALGWAERIHFVALGLAFAVLAVLLNRGRT